MCHHSGFKGVQRRAQLHQHSREQLPPLLARHAGQRGLIDVEFLAAIEIVVGSTLAIELGVEQAATLQQDFGEGAQSTRTGVAVADALEHRQ